MGALGREDGDCPRQSESLVQVSGGVGERGGEKENPKIFHHAWPFFFPRTNAKVKVEKVINKIL